MIEKKLQSVSYNIDFNIACIFVCNECTRGCHRHR